MPLSKRDKTTGLPIPSPVVPATSICLTLRVPNALEYRSALKGAISELGKPWTWAQTVGQDNPDAFQAAELMRVMISEAVYQLDCGDGMSCDDVANCIETNEAVQAAIVAQSGGSPVFGGPYAEGTPLSTAQLNAQLNVPDACDPDVFWAQSDQYIDYMIDLGQDVLERLQLYSEALASGVSTVPGGQFIAKLKNGSTAGKVTEFLNWAVGTFKNAYESADTTDNRNGLKCAIFCEMRDDCLITIQKTLDVLNTRLGGVLSPSDLDDLPALAEAMTTIVFNPALAMDLWVLFLMATAKTAGLFGTRGIDETIQLVLSVAANDPSNDWELLCGECATTQGFIVYGNIGTTSVIQDGTTYTITGAFIGGNSDKYLYVGSSVDGVASNSTTMAYTALSIAGAEIFDWGNDSGTYVTEPPTSAPPPNVMYAGGFVDALSPDTLQITITTDLPFQGIVQGA